MKNRRRRREEDFRKAEIYNALTFGLSGLINCVRSLRGEMKLIRELDEEIRQAELEEKRSGAVGKKRRKTGQEGLDKPRAAVAEEKRS